MRRARRALAAPFRWLAVGLLLDNRLTNSVATGLLIAAAWIRGAEAQPPPMA